MEGRKNPGYPEPPPDYANVDEIRGGGGGGGAPYPAPGFNPGMYPPPPNQYTVTQGPPVLTSQPQPVTVVVTTASLGHNPARVTCGQCGHNIVTSTEKTASSCAWISCGLICCFVGWLGCCLIPFCMDSCYDVDHKCPDCGAHLGTHRAQ